MKAVGFLGISGIFNSLACGPTNPLYGAKNENKPHALWVLIS